MISDKEQYDSLDPIQKLDYNATVNLGRQNLITRDVTFYSEYEFIPIQEDRKQLMQEALNNWHNIMKPTVEQLRQRSNVQEIQDRIYRNVQQKEGQLNTCVFQAKNVKDVNYCSDQFINFLNGDGLQFLKNVLKEY